MLTNPNALDDMTLEHMLVSYSKQAVNGLCAAGAESPDFIARSAFDIAEACINELQTRMSNYKNRAQL